MGRILLILLLGAMVPSSVNAADPSCSYEVKAGDTLGAIALRHGITEADLIASDAKLRKNPNLLQVGQTLDLCAARRRTKPRGAAKAGSSGGRCGRGGHLVEHEVRPGETLGKIALEHGVTPDAIVKRTESLDSAADLLRVGDVLQICVGSREVGKSKLCNFEMPLFVHEVVPGEHLGQIAGRYGVRRRDLMRWNPKLRGDPNLLSVGTRLRVCPEIAPRERTRMMVEVQPGDTLGGIAVRYGLTPNELERFQRGKLIDRNALKPGQKLVVWADGDIVGGFGGRDTDRGVLKRGVQLPPGSGYMIKRVHSAWGTAKAINSIQSAVANYRRRASGGPKVRVGDISRKGGGKFPPHMSHQHGRDVDVGYILKGDSSSEPRFRAANKNNLDVRRTWLLVKSFIDTNQVTYIFMDYRIQKLLYEYAKSTGISEESLDELFQYPRGRGRSHGIIRHWRGHVGHFHVRFRT